MTDEPQMIRGIDWRSTFPFTLIFRSFRIAIHPSKLLLALATLALIYLGGRVLDGVWLARPQFRAVPSEIQLFESTRLADAPREAFDRTREDLHQSLVAQHLAMLGALNKPNADDGDLEWRIRDDRDKEIARINAEFDRTDKVKFPAAARFRDDSRREAYSTASIRLHEVEAWKGEGLSQEFFEYELGQLYAIASDLRSLNLLGDSGVGAAMGRFFVTGPVWAITQHGVFFTIFGLFSLVIWSVFGGAIARIAAVHVARDEKISIRQALAFSMSKFLSFISAPIIPLLLALVVGLLLSLGGLLGNVPGIGGIIIGALYFLALIAGFVMTLILLGAAGGFNLMYPTIAAEGSDSFDAISRSFSYLYARPWRLAFYTLVAAIYGAICFQFVRLFIYLMLWLSRQFTAVGFRWYHADNAMPLWNVMWPGPIANGRLAYAVDWAALSPLQSAGAGLLMFWIYLVIAMLGAFAISFYFSSNTVIYFLMRSEVDATEMDDVYLELGDEDLDAEALPEMAEVVTPAAPAATSFNPGTEPAMPNDPPA